MKSRRLLLMALALTACAFHCRAQPGQSDTGRALIFPRRQTRLSSCV